MLRRAGKSVDSRKYKLGVFAFVLISVLILVLWGAWRSANAHSVAVLREAEDSLKREIDRELPAGSDRKRVEQFLNKRALSTEGYRELGSDFQPLYNGANAIIFANSDNIKTTISVCNIFLTFRFDKAGKMEGYSEKVACKGPF